MLDTLHSERFCDRSPMEVYATLLEKDRYLCSPRTMYRILADSRKSASGRNQLRHPRYQRPELVATPAQPGLVVGHHQAQGSDQVGPTSTST